MLRRVLVTLLCAAALHADPLVSTVEVELKVPHAANAGGVSVWLSGACGTPDLNESAKTDTAGRAVIHTRRTSFQYVVVRRSDCDIAIAGDRKQIAVGGDWVRFRRGRLDLTILGTMARPDHVHASEEPVLALRKKTPGKARFLFCLEDSLKLRHAFHPEQPTPAGKVYVTGSWNNFSTVTPDENGQPAHAAFELFDDGSLVENSGDDLATDGVFTREVYLAPGEHQYLFFVLGNSGANNGLVTDPYEEGRRVVPVPMPYCAPERGVAGTITSKIPVSTIQVPAPESGEDGGRGVR